jgi:soluble lytic murein transglycosylase-like protein
MCLGIHNSAVAQTKVSLVIETYTSAPMPAPVVAPAVSRPVEAGQATGSKTVLNAAYALFAQMGNAGQSSASGQGAARKAMQLVYGSSVLTASGESTVCAGVGYRPSGMLSADNEETRRVLYPLVWREACRAGVPAGLLDALIIHESRYRVDAVSPKGAVGLTQLMPGTAANLGVNSWSIEDNVRGGARYLHSMLESFGQYHLALAAYNAGPGAVMRSGGIPAFRETQTYVGDIIRRWSALAGN